MTTYCSSDLHKFTKIVEGKLKFLLKPFQNKKNQKSLKYLPKKQSFSKEKDCSHLSTAVARRKKKSKHFVFNKYFSLVLGVLKSKISKKSFEPLLRKLDFKLFHYKARVQPVSKITTIATRNRCWM